MINDRQSKVSTMHFIQMLVAFLVSVIRYHLVRRALKAHALTAARAGYTIASICPDHWNST